MAAAHGNTLRDAAHHRTIDQACRRGSRPWLAALKPKGRLTLIHRADRLDALLAEVRRYAGEIVVFPLWPKSGRPAKRVLVSAKERRGNAACEWSQAWFCMKASGALYRGGPRRP